uniref:Uncharacterized protein n=1 Tax=Loxodonta africana TaxID=9785 RepID=G3UGA1_LOXAF
VRLHVLAEVVAAHEALVAHWAGKALLACVGPQVPLQLVGAREALPAEEPVAHEGPLARVPAQVRLEVRRLAVHLAAARDVAAVQALAPQAGPGRAQSLSLLAVGAVAGGATRVAARRRARGAPQRRRRPSGQHGASGAGQRRRGRVWVGAGQHWLEAVHEVLPGGAEQVRGGAAAEGRVAQRVVASERRVQRGLEPPGSRVQRAGQRRGAVGVLHVDPARAHVPPARGARRAHVARSAQARVRGLERVRHAHAQVDTLQPVHRGVHLGDEHRLVGAVLRVRRGYSRGLEHRVVVGEGRAATGGEGEGARAGRASAAKRVGHRRAAVPGGPRHAEAGETGAHHVAAAGRGRRGAFPGMKAFAEGRRAVRERRGRRAGTADLIAGSSEHGQRSRSQPRFFL